jgi:hypothetical protein
LFYENVQGSWLIILVTNKGSILWPNIQKNYLPRISSKWCNSHFGIQRTQCTDRIFRLKSQVFILFHFPYRTLTMLPHKMWVHLGEFLTWLLNFHLFCCISLCCLSYFTCSALTKLPHRTMSVPWWLVHFTTELPLILS